MRRASSTVVAVVGERAAEVVAGLRRHPNVRTIVRGDRTAAEVADDVARATATYVVHDADPLAEVGDAWVDWFDGGAPAGRLEVATEAALGAFRGDRLVLPDYYVVLEPDDLPATRRHWYLGVLAGAAPARVVPAPARVAAVAHELGALPTGRWWPDDLAEWLHRLPRTVPDRVGLPTS